VGIRAVGKLATVPCLFGAGKSKIGIHNLQNVYSVER
jgi:hypothetical protein